MIFRFFFLVLISFIPFWAQAECIHPRTCELFECLKSIHDLGIEPETRFSKNGWWYEPSSSLDRILMVTPEGEFFYFPLEQPNEKAVKRIYQLPKNNQHEKDEQVQSIYASFQLKGGRNFADKSKSIEIDGMARADELSQEELGQYAGGFKVFWGSEQQDSSVLISKLESEISNLSKQIEKPIHQAEKKKALETLKKCKTQLYPWKKPTQSGEATVQTLLNQLIPKDE